MRTANHVEFNPKEKRAVLTMDFTPVEKIENVERLLVLDTVVSYVDASEDRVDVLLKGPSKWSFDGETLRIGSSKWLRLKYGQVTLNNRGVRK